MTEVICNVYTLLSKDNLALRHGNSALDVFGVSIYHAGIEIFGLEYSFGLDPTFSHDPNVDGIFSVEPREAVGEFKEAIVLGRASIDPRGFHQLLQQLAPRWRAMTYHLLNRNCCHFARDLAVSLNPAFEQTFPHYVLRAASVGSAVVPESVLQRVTEMVAPPPAVPPHLRNVVAWKNWRGGTPPPGDARPVPRDEEGLQLSQPTTGNSRLNSLLSVARGAVVQAHLIASDTRRSQQQQKFIDTFSGEQSFFPHELVSSWNASVVYLNREHDAVIWISLRLLCFSNGRQLRRVYPLTDIASLHYGRILPSEAPGLPPRDVVLADGPQDEHTALLVFFCDGSMVPVFRFRSTVGVMQDAFRRTTGGDVGVGDSVRTLETAFNAIDSTWRAAVVRARRGDQLY